MSDGEELTRRLAALAREEGEASAEEEPIAPLSEAEMLGLKTAARAAFEPRPSTRTWVKPLGAALVLAAACALFFLRPIAAPSRYQLEMDLKPSAESRGPKEGPPEVVTDLDFSAVLRPSTLPESAADARAYDVTDGAPHLIETSVEHAANGAIRVRGRVASGHSLLFTVGPAALLDEPLRQQWILDPESAPPAITIIRWSSSEGSRTP